MQDRVDKFIDGCSQASSEKALRDFFKSVIKDLGYAGYDAFSYRLDQSMIGGPPDFIVTSYAPNLLDPYLAGLGEICPGMTEICSAMVPFEYLAFLERSPKNESVTWQKQILRVMRVKRAWCIPLSVVGSMRAVTIYMRGDGPEAEKAFEDSREYLATVSRYFMQALVAFRCGGSGGEDGDVKIELSTRERDCLYLAATGKSNPQIGESLRISVNTVGFHLKNAYRKLNASNRTTAVRRAEGLGILVRM